MIKFYGKFIKKCGKSLKCKVNSVREVLQATEANRPGFKDLIEKDRMYVIRRGDTFKTAKDVSEEELEMNFSETTWHILPLPVGHGGFVKAVVGVALIVVGTFVPVLSPYLYPLGVSMVLGGVAQMLAPTPPTMNDYGNREAPDKRPSYLFDGPINKTATGGAIPLVYGFDVFVGSTFVSGGIDIGDIA